MGTRTALAEIKFSTLSSACSGLPTEGMVCPEKWLSSDSVSLVYSKHATVQQPLLGNSCVALVSHQQPLLGNTCVALVSHQQPLLGNS